MSELTDKQQTLCEEYIVDLDVKEAAKRANISYGYARQLLTKSNILNEIQRLKASRSIRTEIEADSVVKELAKIAFSSIQDFLTVDEEGEVFLKNFDDIEPEKLAAIESIKISTTRNKDDSREYTTTQFKLCSKLNALEQLGRHLGIYNKDKKLDVNLHIDALDELLEAIDGGSRGKPTDEEVEKAKASRKLKQ